jgi:hypothetical protein
MTPMDWAGLAVSIFTLVAGFATLIRWMVKHYLAELKPNGGSSIKDKVNNLEHKVDLLTDLVKEVLRK